MFIAVLDFSSAASDRPSVLAQLDGERDEVRSMPGNLAFRVYASRVDDRRVAVIHEWEDEESFAGYLTSEAFARMGRALRPMATEAPVSRRFRAELLETVG